MIYYQETCKKNIVPDTEPFSVSGIAGRGDSSLIRPVPDAETLPSKKSNYDANRNYFISCSFPSHVQTETTHLQVTCIWHE